VACHIPQFFREKKNCGHKMCDRTLKHAPVILTASVLYRSVATELATDNIIEDSLEIKQTVLETNCLVGE
jgi:hypothetical protein